MGFASFDYKGKRYWMGAGNVRTCQQLEKEDRDKDLKGFLQRISVSVTTPAETIFRHPSEQDFAATQTAPGFAGVPQSEAPPGEVPLEDERE